jgi:hypothetical protein
MGNQKDWKDALLKTSLPLEYLIASKLSNKGCGIQGEFHYLRPNENGVVTEFSVDVWASSPLIKKKGGLWGHVNYLIECKHCHDSVKWVFAPHTKNDVEQLSEKSIVHVLDRLCTRRIFDKTPLWQLGSIYPSCYKGIELQTKDATAQNIEKGRHQLVYGAFGLAVHLSGVQMNMYHDEDLHIEFLCPILVTTADLYILKRGLRLEDFTKAKSHDDISTPAPALILTNPYSHLFSDYSDSQLSALHNRKILIKSRVEQLEKLVNKITNEEEGPVKIPGYLWFDWDIRDVATRVLVVNYKNFDAVIGKLRQSVVSASKSLTQVGHLQHDISKQITWVTD